ncbi:MAG TPA: cytidylate kinase-like family protein [Solirubrobacterales bacterium]|nr:cytidylate kinase-like family protein [Solirubrobacterales bacterium]
MRKLVTISASYGAGGNVVGPALAERLGVPFLDRAIPVKVAEQLQVEPEEVDAVEDDPPSLLERLLRGFSAGDSVAPTWLPGIDLTPEDFRRETEKVLLAQCQTGEGVMLGRAGAIVLRDDPRVLRVRLDGPRDARVRQAMGFGGIDEATARRTAEHLDRTHVAYARELYGADIRDFSLYDLMIDATRIGIDACVELIYAAAAETRGP